MDEAIGELKRVIMDAVCAYTAATERRVLKIDLSSVEIEEPFRRKDASGMLRITVSARDPDKPGLVWVSMV